MVLQPNKTVLHEPNSDPNSNPNYNLEAIHNPNHNLNPIPKHSNSCLTILTRDKNSFLPIIFQEIIFNLRHGEWFGISFHKIKYNNLDYVHTFRAFSQEFS